MSLLLKSLRHCQILQNRAWIIRVWQVAHQREGPYGELVDSEMLAERSYWIQDVQSEYFSAEIKALHKNLPLPDDPKIARFNPFLDEGFIGLGGRLQSAELSQQQRHPLLLDGQYHFTKLLALQTHISFHHFGGRIVLAELPDEYWTLRTLQTSRRYRMHVFPTRSRKIHLDSK
jgi:hypothetical protein